MLAKGTTLAGYRIDGVLGQGGMGGVYEATQLSLNRTVALKVLAPHLSEDVAFRERFRREGQIQAGIDHPHIVTVFEAGDTEHGLFLAMRLIRGPNLKDMIVSRELDAGRSLRILMPVAEALDAAHEAGLIHRDVKPQNILVGGRDHPYLADFGLTKAPGETSLTKTGQFVGTLDYISPEQIRGDRAGGQSDVYALAAVLYECLTGVVPYPKESEAAVLYAHMSDPAPSVTEQRPELSGSLDEVLHKGMAKTPSERYESAGELLRAAEHAFGKRIRAALKPPGPIEIPEETGIRAAEVDVRTREADLREEVPAAPTALRGDRGAPGTIEAPTEETPPAEAPAEDTQTAAAAPVEPPADATQAAEAPAPEEPADATQAAEAPAREEPAAEETQRVESPSAGLTKRRARSSGGAAPPAPPAVPPSTARARREPRPLMPGAIGIVAAVALVAIVAGFLLGSSGTEEATPSEASNTSSTTSLELGFPDSWQRLRAGLDIPGVDMKSPMALGPKRRPSGEGLIAGEADRVDDSTLLGSGLLRRLGARPSRDTVRLGELEAYRYANLKPKGSNGALTLYTVPTTRGVATVACLGGTGGGRGFLRECEAVAASLKLTASKPFGLGPDEGYARRLDTVMDSINSARKTEIRSLRRGRRPADQAQAADRLARAYRAGARRLGRAPVSPERATASVAIVRSLGRAGSGYGRLSSAARRGSRPGYDRARRAIRVSEDRVRSALRALERVGYTVR